MNFCSLIPAKNQTVSKYMGETQEFDESYFFNWKFVIVFFNNTAYFCNKKAFVHYEINIFLNF